MKWLLELMLNNRNIEQMKQTFHRLNIPYLLVQVKDNQIFVLNHETLLIENHSEEILDSFISTNDVLAYGSKSLANAVESYGIQPGTFKSDSLDYNYLKEIFGNYLFNADGECAFIHELEVPKTNVFLRPNKNNKLFNGGVYTPVAFEKLKIYLIEQGLHENEPVIIAPLKMIQQEFRFFIVNQEIVTYSCYKPNTTEKCSIPLLDSVKQWITHSGLPFAYTLDVVVGEGGYYIMELNNICTSGLYGANIESILLAFEKTKEGSSCL